MLPDLLPADDSGAWNDDNLTNVAEATIAIDAGGAVDSLSVYREGALVGEAGGAVTAKKDLLVRVDTPRFLTQEDEVTITATVHNNTAVAAELSLQVATNPQLTIDSAASAAARIGPRRIRPSDFRLHASGQGLGKITATAMSNVGSDAARTGLPILPRGLRTLVGRSGNVTEEAIEVFDLPDRGRLAVGLPADVAIFDPDTVGCSPLRRVHDFPGGADRLIADAEGMRAVIVNGVVIREDGRDAVDAEGPLPGQLLRSR